MKQPKLIPRIKPMSRKVGNKTVLDISSVLEMEEEDNKKRKVKDKKNYI